MGCAAAEVCGHAGHFAADAQPVHRVEVDGFWMDETDVTNAQFAEFVRKTGYLTVAERPADPGLPAGSLVFTPPAGETSLDDDQQWWSFRPGANWRHPEGPTSTIIGRGQFPVVQVAFDDAVAYAHWAGERLPTEAEWEFAARGGFAGQFYPWGSELTSHGRWMANLWQGTFPSCNTAQDGFAGLAPVAQFPPNAYGLYDMAGNVWQWCADWYRPDYYGILAGARFVAKNPPGPPDSIDPEEPGVPKRVQRGGSFLCSAGYCERYVVGSRGKGDPETASNHLGFRCVAEAKPHS